MELTKIETRKQSRRWIQEYAKRKQEDDEEAAEAEMKKMADTRGTAFGAQRTSIMDDKSMWTSPTKASPARSKTFTGAASEYDTVSTRTGVTGRSPTKGGMDLNAVLEKINFREIASKVKAKAGAAGGGGKSGLDKLSRMGGAQGTSLKSQAKSIRSGATRQTGTKSYKSNKDTDYEDLDLFQLTSYPEAIERDIQKYLKDLYNTSRQLKNTPQMGRETKLKVIEEALNLERNRLIYILQLINEKTPHEQKLPKDHQYYLHQMQMGE